MLYSRLAHFLLGTLLAIGAVTAHAALQTREITYAAADGSALQAYYAWDDSVQGKRPGVLVVHEWWGLNDYARRRARELAALGYAALAIDMYGQGRHTERKEEAQMLMHGVTADGRIARARALAGLQLLQAQPQVDAGRIAAIGYCFGGKIVLDMARQGLDLAGVVSFHGILATATPAQAGQVKARVLVLNGEADPFVPATDVTALQTEMKNAGVNFRYIAYAGAKHAFTSPDADRLGRENGMDIAYDAAADAASWAAMQEFFRQIFWPANKAPAAAPGRTPATAPAALPHSHAH